MEMDEKVSIRKWDEEFFKISQFLRTYKKFIMIPSHLKIDLLLTELPSSKSSDYSESKPSIAYSNIYQGLCNKLSLP